jgi:hypothetical protein
LEKFSLLTIMQIVLKNWGLYWSLLHHCCILLYLYLVLERLTT